MKAPPGWAQNEVHGVKMGWVGSKLRCASVLFALGAFIAPRKCRQNGVGTFVGIRQKYTKGEPQSSQNY